MKLCIHCGHRVGQGDRHAKTACPQRGVVIAGTGVPKQESHG